MDTILWATALAAALGLGALAVLAEATEPLRIPLSDVSEHPDRTVTVRGRVLAVEPLASGSQRLVLADGNRSLAVFLREQLGLFAGDVVDATGRVARYHGVWELVVEEAEDIVLVTAWSENRTPLAEIAQEPWRFVGTHVRTLGALQVGARPPPFLGDVGTGDRIRLAGLEDSWADGAVVELTGVVEYDPGDNLFRLRVEAVWPATGAYGA